MTDELKNYALQLKEQKLFEMEDLYQLHLREYIPIFQKNFNDVCRKIITLQQSGRLGPLSYLEYTLLYTNLMQRKSSAEVRGYSDSWYLDSRQEAIGDFDFSYLFQKYWELWDQLLNYRKRFAGEVAAQEITEFLLSCARSFYSYVVSVCRFSILPCIEKEPFLTVLRAEEFEINIGEYMSHTEAIYKENQKRDAKTSLKWFSNRKEYEYAFEDFTGLDFSGADLSEIDLRYSDLRRAILKGTDFQDSMLFGTRFCGADMRDADLRYCLLHEADFTGACLENANFIASEAYAGVPSQSVWQITGYQGVSFRNANLRNTDFRRNHIRDADFTGAIMDGALFNQQELNQFRLSPEQKQAIKIVENTR